VSTHGSWLPAGDGATALDRAGLVLAGANESERGVWTGRQVVASGASARTVVLSACETGAASPVPGDGVYGLVRAFQLGGAREVVATNWPVQDVEAVAFTKDLHRSLPGADAARAPGRPARRDPAREPPYGVGGVGGLVGVTSTERHDGGARDGRCCPRRHRR
jgi:CHAT domain-containing protein